MHKRQPCTQYTEQQIAAYANANCSTEVAASTAAYHAQNKRNIAVSNAQYVAKRNKANQQTNADQQGQRTANAQRLAQVLAAQEMRVNARLQQLAAQRKVELAAKRQKQRTPTKTQKPVAKPVLSKVSKARVQSVAKLVKARPSAHYMQTLAVTNKLRAAIALPPIEADDFSATYARFMLNRFKQVASRSTVVSLFMQAFTPARHSLDLAA